MVTDKEKNKKEHEVYPIKNIYKNSKNFQKRNFIQKEFLLKINCLTIPESNIIFWIKER